MSYVLETTSRIQNVERGQGALRRPQHVGEAQPTLVPVVGITPDPSRRFEAVRLDLDLDLDVDLDFDGDALERLR
ncbi:MAG: hypothetical protein ACOCUS_01210 [Polyangiales bacterium]